MRRIITSIVTLTIATAMLMTGPASGGDIGPAPRGGAPSPAMTDFNGDGFADFAVGARYEDIGTIQDAGGVNVLYGTAAGLQATSPDDQFWHQNSRGIKDKAETDDWFGRGLMTGDFNGDGFSDMASGSPHEDLLGFSNAGGVNIIYGSPAGLQPEDPINQWFSQNTAGVEDQVEEFDEFGDYLAAGDFNADGYEDLAIGDRQESIDEHNAAGAVNVLYGGPNGLQVVDPADQFWTQDNIGAGEAAEGGAQFGRFVWAADFDGDGFADLAIGAPFETVDGVPMAGGVDVLYGGPGGLQTTNPPTEVWNQNSPGIAGDGAENDDEFAYFVAGNDLDGDGFDDLTVGARYDDVGSVPDAGTLTVLYGTASGLSTVRSQFWTEDSPGMVDDSEAAEGFARAFAPCDFNGDGFGDVAVSVPSEDAAAPSGGAIHVMYGTEADGLQADSPDDQQWTQDSPGVPGDGAQSGDAFGYIETADDFNGDGFCDLSGSALYDSVGSVPGAGQTRTIYGSAAGLQTASPPAQAWHQDSPSVREIAEEHDLLGAGTS